jgi:hypothetical protein
MSSQQVVQEIQIGGTAVLAPRSEPEGRPLFFVSGLIDTAMIGGLSICVFLAIFFLTSGSKTPAVVDAVAVASVFVNYPHFSATLYRLYQSPANVRQFPTTAIGVPLLIAAAVCASLWQPDLVAPYLVGLFLIWSPFHYSGQTIGITMLYARRGGLQSGRWWRPALSIFVYATFIVGFTHATGTEPVLRYGVAIPRIHFPVWFDVAAIAVMVVSAATFLIATILGSAAHRSARLLVPLPALAQFVWFLPGARTAMFQEFVPFFHCLQYLYIAWAMQVGTRMSEPVPGGKPRKLFDESLRWAGRNYVGGLFLFVGMPWLGFWLDLPIVTSAGVVLAAINIHHFFVDGVIWKLRDATATSPLMMNIADWHARPASA